MAKGEPSMIAARAWPAPAAASRAQGGGQRRAQPLGRGRRQRRLPVLGDGADDLDPRRRAVDANDRGGPAVDAEAQGRRALLFGIGAGLLAQVGDASPAAGAGGVELGQPVAPCRLDRGRATA